MAILGHIFWIQWRGDKGLTLSDSKLIIPVITFQVTQPIRSGKFNVTARDAR